MDELLNLSNLKTVLTTLGAFITTIVFAFNVKGIIEFLDWHRTKQEKYLKDMLTVSDLDPPTKEALVDHLNYVIYRKIARLAVDKFTREKIQALVNKSKGELQDFQVSRAWKYIERENGRLSVRISTADKWEDGVTRFFALIFLLMAGLGVFACLNTKSPGPERLALLCIGFMFFCGATFFVWQSIPMSVAKKIAPVLAKLQDEVPTSPPQCESGSRNVEAGPRTDAKDSAAIAG